MFHCQFPIRLLAVVCCLVCVGCGPSTTTEAPAVSADSRTADAEATSLSDSKPLAGRSQALAAKDALFEKLSTRLVQVMSASGPAAAIEVCSQEARSIAETVGREQGVKIGRTSFRLRNSDNQPPAWAREFVDQRMDTPQFLRLDSGDTAALLPIKLQPQCLACHGQADELAPGVADKLAALYPNDAATGFAAGDLRGWFWIEVPVQESLSGSGEN